MSFWTIFTILVGVVGSLLTIFEFISSRIGSSPKRSRQLAFMFGAVTLALVLISVIFANVLSSQLGTSPGIAPTHSITTPLSGTGDTPTPTQVVPTATPIPSPTQNSTPTSASPFDYPAAHPGPGCDTGGGTWVTQGVNNITCSTWVSNITTASRGYIDLQQLPKNAAFAANNKISITFSNIDSLNSSCFGLAEQSANKGYLVAYCVNGAWTIYEISNQGAVIQTLSSNFTSIRSNTTLSLTLVNTTLIFVIDAESHQISISSIKPTEVAIAFYDNGCGNCTAVATNFNYITPAS